MPGDSYKPADTLKGLQDLDHSLLELTGLSAKERQEVLYWLARQGEEVKVGLMRNRFKLFHDLKRTHGKKYSPQVLEYAALVIVSRDAGAGTEARLKSKHAPEDEDLVRIEEIRQAKARGMKVAKRGLNQGQKLRRKWGIVVKLKEAGLSFQDIAEYMKAHHKISVSRAYIHKLYKQWQTEGERK